MPTDDEVSARWVAALAARAADRLDAATAAGLTERATRLLPQGIALLRRLYGDATDALVAGLVDDLVGLAVDRPSDLRELDRRRSADPWWFQDPSMIGYVCYADRFAGTLRGIPRHLDHLERLGVRYLHLMPVLVPRAGESDGGYAVADYDAVDPRLGTMAELTELARQVHARDMALCVDLVLNHTAREHPWAHAAMRGDATYRDFYFVFPDRTGPDEYERTVPDVFPVLAPGSFTFVPELDGWVWTTFREFQWDLDYRNPAVFRAMAATMITLANRGPDVLRLDAVPFLWKRAGTTCQNQPEVHVVLQALRCLLSIVAPGVLLKAEAMVAPEILTGYLGAGEGGVRHECDLAYDNQLMVMLWAVLATGDGALARHALNRRPAAPATTSWVTYLRCHDDIGWAVDDVDAAAVGLTGVGHRAFLSDHYTGRFPGSDAAGLTFQENPATGDRRVSGTAADLTGFRSAATPEQVDLAVRRVLLAYAVVLGWGGIPVVWSGDELGLVGDADWARDPAHAGDNRWYHRPRLDDAARGQRHDLQSPAGRVFAGLRELAARRAGLPMLHAATPSRVLDADDPGVLTVLRSHPEGDLLELFNVTETWRPFPGHRLIELGLGQAHDVLMPPGETAIAISPDGNVWLAPYRASWLILRP